MWHCSKVEQNHMVFFPQFVATIVFYIKITTEWSFMRIGIILSLGLFTAMTSAQTLSSEYDRRTAEELSSEQNTFTLIPHKPSYILPITYNDKIKSLDTYGDDRVDNDLQQIEVEFQFSLKVPIISANDTRPFALFAAYTQRSIWQAYNFEKSSPFRETNYEPELFATWYTDSELFSGWKLSTASLGFVHQSNGRVEPLSRSWNRIEMDLVVSKDNWAITLNPWFRLEEPASKDNNPDLVDYYGHGKVVIAYHASKHTFALESRNNLESGFSKGSLEASWSFPIHGKVKGMVKAFSGYGNSMIEYDHYTNSIGFGVNLVDWL